MSYLRFRLAGGLRLDFGLGRWEVPVRAVVRVAAAVVTEAAAAPAAGVAAEAVSARRALMASRAAVRSWSWR